MWSGVFANETLVFDKLTDFTVLLNIIMKTCMSIASFTTTIIFLLLEW